MKTLNRNAWAAWLALVLLFTLFCIQAAWAADPLPGEPVQSATSKDQDTVSLVGVRDGNAVLIWAKSENDGGPLSVRDDQQTVLTAVAPLDVAGRVHGAFFYVFNAKGGNRTYTVTWANGAAYKRIIATEVPGVSAVWDAVGIANGAGAGNSARAVSDNINSSGITGPFVVFGAVGCAGCGASDGKGVPGAATAGGQPFDVRMTYVGGYDITALWSHRFDVPFGAAAQTIELPQANDWIAASIILAQQAPAPTPPVTTPPNRTFVAHQCYPLVDSNAVGFSASGSLMGWIEGEPSARGVISWWCLGKYKHSYAISEFLRKNLPAGVDPLQKFNEAVSCSTHECMTSLDAAFQIGPASDAGIAIGLQQLQTKKPADPIWKVKVDGTAATRPMYGVITGTTPTRNTKVLSSPRATIGAQCACAALAIEEAKNSFCPLLETPINLTRVALCAQ